MSILDRILGRTPTASPQITAQPNKAGPATKPPPITDLPDVAISMKSAPPPPSDEPMMRVYDQFGRAVSIGRETWRKDVLQPNLAAARDKPDALYDLIVSALNDGFAEDVLDAARALAANDPHPPRGATVLGIALLQLRDLPGARDVLQAALAKFPDDPYLLTHLARAFESTDPARADELIWRALALAPNEEFSLNWLISTAHARANDNGGRDAILAAYTRAAQLPGSWRAQLWLARYALEGGKLADATKLYEEALGRATPPPGDLLMQLSGDLGNAGQTALLVQLTRPRFDLETHGLAVGNNLIRAYLELGMLAEARALLEQLYARQRPDWREHLLHWERKIDDAQRKYGEINEPIELIVMRLEQPVWARGTLDFDALLPAKAASAPRIQFVCASGEGPVDPKADGRVVSQPTNELGRLSRALPMFLAEEVFLRTNARAAFLLPWLKTGGFILSAKPWTRAFLPADQSPPDVLVFTHIDAAHSPWLVRVTIEQPTRPEARPVTFEQAFEFRTAAQDAMTLLNDVITRVTILLALRREDTSDELATPPATLMSGYLSGIEEALAVGLAARLPNAESFLYQERAMFDHLFDVALHGEQQARPRLLLVNALENEARRRPDIVREYLEKLALLQDKHPLPPGRAADLVAKAISAVTDKANAG
ncbi:MAG TPA: tetratricopeptide repeat protein [Steroidobacteraceae bacterium]|nr:tetratricopeptide repeat protein [Steroidobacteraceae bacterium]